MPEQQGNNPQQPGAAVDNKQGVEPQGATAQQGALGATSDDQGDDKHGEWFRSLPADAQEVVSRLRSESAQRRKELKAEREARKTLEQQLAELQSQLKRREDEELEEQNLWREAAERYKREREELERALKRERLLRVKSQVAHEMKLPALFADRLQGESEDEIREDAKRLMDAVTAVIPNLVSSTTQPTQSSPSKPRVTQTTTPVPSGPPAVRTDTDRAREYVIPNTNTPIFHGGQVVYHGLSSDLNQTVK